MIYGRAMLWLETWDKFASKQMTSRCVQQLINKRQIFGPDIARSLIFNSHQAASSARMALGKSAYDVLTSGLL